MRGGCDRAPTTEDTRGVSREVGQSEIHDTAVNRSWINVQRLSSVHVRPQLSTCVSAATLSTPSASVRDRDPVRGP